MDFMLPFDSYLEKHRYKYAALYHALRDAILNGTLQGGTRLPSSRWLAEHYGLSRGSIAEAYDMLLADGYVQAEVGRGTFVAPVASPQPPAHRESSIVLSPWGRRLMQNKASSTQATGIMGQQAAECGKSMISLIPQGMQQEHFPYAEWKSALYAAAREATAPGAEDSAGAAELRENIAAHLRLTRGIRADASAIVLFSGSMQGITLLTQLLVAEGEDVVLEQSCYPGIQAAVKACGGRLLPAALDREGIIPGSWDSRLLFVTPARQYPTGAVLSLSRRRELLGWASRHNAVIIEDDYDSEFCWGGRPVEPLKALDMEERVIYIGSFSKTMPTSFRLGYALVPPALVGPLLEAKRLYDPLPPGLLEQRALARFMARGGYARHLRRMTRLYGARHDYFCTSMRRHAPDLFELEPGDAGLHMYARWKRAPEKYPLFLEAAAAHGVLFRDMAAYHLVPSAPSVSFGFAHLNEEQLDEGARRLAAAWGSLV
ncbi:PLP-dependent aminotransferase family protein [Paenibacillus sp. P96]|uniref:PLP-dependent aminotransferase family protein n=1 Tax=Paenibacillus zeirhizosphaerae TaxID=2987519 RepID=A0ABT9FUU4_9BACL|nr:PLP-dependent aminotransferase family protein [Paenibacillus sp. P96]MDP4098475.1 PLP-dependent aminotransferase family protein [Paenibacillus sp. P96]